MEKFLTVFLSVLAIATIAVIMAFNAQGNQVVERDITLDTNTDDEASFAVVELFTSEGCSSCPPADKLLGKIVDSAQKTDVRIFALAFHVDYWDYLGWKDAYSSAAFSQRQKEYASAFRSNRIYTPQMIVNGEHEFVGSSQRKAEKYVQQALKQSAKVNLSIEAKVSEARKVTIRYQADTIPSNSIINFALVERNIVRDIKRGENHGRTLRHDNVVRSFQKSALSTKKGKALLEIPEDGVIENSSVIVYVQNRKNMQVMGAEGMDLASRLQ